MCTSRVAQVQTDPRAPCCRASARFAACWPCPPPPLLLLRWLPRRRRSSPTKRCAQRPWRAVTASSYTSASLSKSCRRTRRDGAAVVRGSPDLAAGDDVEPADCEVVRACGLPALEPGNVAAFATRLVSLAEPTSERAIVRCFSSVSALRSLEESPLLEAVRRRRNRGHPADPKVRELALVASCRRTVAHGEDGRPSTDRRSLENRRRGNRPTRRLCWSATIAPSGPIRTLQGGHVGSASWVARLCGDCVPTPAGPAALLASRRSASALRSDCGFAPR